ncbi:unnamed protein product [Protopolystoma xenopodis]|uniref:Uncharacterized protein n=1 Tax=Protopolystoma xenopodis TaxID=117903 RepID=A0A448WXM4_9PLAT|nr:unnamed protein product [Protopolystoma xenopodis]
MRARTWGCRNVGMFDVAKAGRANSQMAKTPISMGRQTDTHSHTHTHTATVSPPLAPSSINRIDCTWLPTCGGECRSVQSLSRRLRHLEA